MNRLQKKCLIATAGFHLLLVVILIVGPGFFTEKPKPDDAQILDVIPATAIDAAFSSGVKSAQPPAPKPIVTPPPKPVAAPPGPTFVKRVEKFFDPEPKPEPVAPEADPVRSEKPEKTVKPKTREIKVDLHKITRAARNSKPEKSTDDSEARAERAERLRAEAIQNAVQNLKSNFTPSMKVEMPGTGSVSYASYASIIKSIYTQAWTPPDDAANDEANAKVSVTVASDGTVVSAHIIGASGDASVDASVRRTLDRVNFIAPFPDGATEKEKTFIINFNLKAKRMLG